MRPERWKSALVVSVAVGVVLLCTVVRVERTSDRVLAQGGPPACRWAEVNDFGADRPELLGPWAVGSDVWFSSTRDEVGGSLVSWSPATRETRQIELPDGRWVNRISTDRAGHSWLVGPSRYIALHHQGGWVEESFDASRGFGGTLERVADLDGQLLALGPLDVGRRSSATRSWTWLSSPSERHAATYRAGVCSRAVEARWETVGTVTLFLCPFASRYSPAFLDVPGQSRAALGRVPDRLFGAPAYSARERALFFVSSDRHHVWVHQNGHWRAEEVGGYRRVLRGVAVVGQDVFALASSVLFQRECAL